MDYNIGDLVKVNGTEVEGRIKAWQTSAYKAPQVLIAGYDEAWWTTDELILVERAAHIAPSDEEKAALREACEWMRHLEDMFGSDCRGYYSDLRNISDEDLSEAIGYVGGIHANLARIEDARTLRRALAPQANDRVDPAPTSSHSGPPEPTTDQ